MTPLSPWSARSIGLRLACFGIISLGPLRAALPDAPPAFVPAGAEQGRRAETVLQAIAARPQGKGVWRHVGEALSNYWLDDPTKGDAAMASLVAEARKKTDNRTAEGLHWQAYQIARIVFLFGAKGSLAPGRMSAESERQAKDVLWQWVEPRGTRALTDPARDWWQWGSENHHIQAWISFWSTLNLLERDPEYAAKTFADGSTVAELKKEFDGYFKRWIRARATRGLFIEVNSPTYAKYSVNGFYNIVDFADDAELQKLAREFLDLCWAQWALEAVEGARGGSRHRSYPGEASIKGNALGNLAWFHFGVGDAESRHPSAFCTITSSYVPPALVRALVDRRSELGSYEITARQPGLLKTSEPVNYVTDVAHPMFYPKGVKQFDPDCGSLLRRTYSTPGFVIGCTMLPVLPLERWGANSAQNRWEGVIFAGAKYASIFTQPLKPKRGSVYNAQWSVQDRGVFLTRRLPETNAKGQRIWFSQGLARLEREGWIFVDAPQAYAAVKVTSGSTQWVDDSSDDWGTAEDFRPGLGQWLVLEDQNAPIVIEVVPKKGYGDFEAFQAEILANTLSVGSEGLDYSSKHYQTRLKLFTDYGRLPQINDTPVDFATGKVFAGPVLEGEFGGESVRLKAFGQEHVFQFAQIR